MPTTNKPRGAETRGTCSLVNCAGTALLWIRPAHGNWQDYWVKKVTNAQGKVVAFVLQMLTGRVEHKPTVYTIDTSFGGGSRWWQCDCPDAQYRKRRGTGKCKHVNALVASMKQPEEMVVF